MEYLQTVKFTGKVSTDRTGQCWTWWKVRGRCLKMGRAEGWVSQGLLSTLEVHTVDSVGGVGSALQGGGLVGAWGGRA